MKVRQGHGSDKGGLTCIGDKVELSQDGTVGGGGLKRSVCVLHFKWEDSVGIEEGAMERVSQKVQQRGISVGTLEKQKA